MKLLKCNNCGDIFNLIYPIKHCCCRKTYGNIVDDKENAQYFGDCELIGFENKSFNNAMMAQHLEDEYQSQPLNCTEGVKFEAFFIPRSSKSFKRMK